MIENMSWLAKLVAVLIVGIPALTGVGLLVAGARRWSRLRALASSGHRAVAQVVDNQMESWSDGRTSYRPVVTFRTDMGQDRRTSMTRDPRSRTWTRATDQRGHSRGPRNAPPRDGQRRRTWEAGR
ncbi:DUF3592 domain-containing protein [Couchioplanes caeruleus]|nr:DUF3592 domain-containing protein [Couchioplanes caeruleus]